MDKQYRVMWRGPGSTLSLQIGETQDDLILAKSIADGPTANGLRAEGCTVWIESRPVGSWTHVVTNRRPSPFAPTEEYVGWLKEWNALVDA